MKDKFKIGDICKVIHNTTMYSENDIVEVTEICGDGYPLVLCADNEEYWYINDSFLELVEEEENRIEEQSSDVCVSTTGALRYNSDKPQLSQIDPLFLIGLSDLMTISAKKYSKWNYAKGQNLTTVCDSMSRHLLSFLNGENDDKESGKSHLLHIAANCIIAYSTTERHLEKHPELDDRINKFLEGLSNE